MKTPEFWASRSLISTLLLPCSALYAVADTLKRLIIRPTILDVPVICIGNVTAGGAGKTPVALAIGERLKARGIGAYFLSRGYGGTSAGPLMVDPRKHSAREVGDEPLLLAAVLPTIVSKDRLLGAQFAVEQGAKIIVMDDGFQNPSIAKTLSLLVIDGSYGFGNGLIIPAGPLRESPASAYKRADAVVTVNPIGKNPALSAGKTMLNAHIQTRNTEALDGQKLIAFCGIAHPEKFFATARTISHNVMETFSFADHHAYSAAEIEALLERAQTQQARLVTTAKDAVRLSPPLRAQVSVIDITLSFEQPDLLDAILDETLKRL